MLFRDSSANLDDLNNLIAVNRQVINSQTAARTTPEPTGVATSTAVSNGAAKTILSIVIKSRGLAELVF